MDINEATFQGAYFMRNCTLDDSQLPPMMPSGNYNLSLRFFTKPNRFEEFVGWIIFDFFIKGKPYFGNGK